MTRRTLGTVSLVSVLLRQSGPSAVLWAVAFVVVCALQAVLAGGSSPHILDKVLETIPTSANFDSSRSVVFESGMVAVGAPILHRRPSPVFGKYHSGNAVTMSPGVRVSFSTFATQFSAKTTTRFCTSGNDTLAIKFPDSTAVAKAQPPGVFAGTSFCKKPNDGQTGEFLSGEISWFSAHNVFLCAYYSTLKKESKVSV